MTKGRCDNCNSKAFAERSEDLESLPVAAIEVDDKGAHVKFDHPGKASSDLFLNNEGASGVMLIDKLGKRRLSAVIDAEGKAEVQQFNDQFKAPESSFVISDLSPPKKRWTDCLMYQT